VKRLEINNFVKGNSERRPFEKAKREKGGLLLVGKNPKKGWGGGGKKEYVEK